MTCNLRHPTFFCRVVTRYMYTCSNICIYIYLYSLQSHGRVMAWLCGSCHMHVIGHFPQKSPEISSFFAENDLQLYMYERPIHTRWVMKYTHTHIHTYTSLHIHAHTHARARTRNCPKIKWNTHTYTHTHAHAHTHTNTHTNTLFLSHTHTHTCTIITHEAPAVVFACVASLLPFLYAGPPLPMHVMCVRVFVQVCVRTCVRM